MTANHGPAEPGTALQAPYEFVPVRSDYVSILRSPQLRVLKLLVGLMLAMFGAALFMSALLVTADGEPAVDPVLLMVLTGPAVLCALIGFGYAPFGGRLAWRKPANREPVRAVLDGEGFRHEAWHFAQPGDPHLQIPAPTPPERQRPTPSRFLPVSAQTIGCPARTSRRDHSATGRSHGSVR